jgi:DNA-binding NarL/FixJ family response regulator
MTMRLFGPASAAWWRRSTGWRSWAKPATDAKPSTWLAPFSRIWRCWTSACQNGLETAERIQHDFPHTCVIIISMHATPQFVSKALRSGAKGYLLKGASREELELALRTVRAGQVYLSSAISRDVIERYLEPAADLVPVTLTTRQREILQLIAESKSTKEIASILKLSAKTVESHRLQLMDRLDIRDVAGLVRYAIRQGLVSAEH